MPSRAGPCSRARPTLPKDGVPEYAVHPSWTADPGSSGARRLGSDGVESLREAHAACHYGTDGSEGTLALDESQEVGTPAFSLGVIFPLFI